MRYFARFCGVSAEEAADMVARYEADRREGEDGARVFVAERDVDAYVAVGVIAGRPLEREWSAETLRAGTEVFAPLGRPLRIAGPTGMREVCFVPERGSDSRDIPAEAFASVEPTRRHLEIAWFTRGAWLPTTPPADGNGGRGWA